MLAIRSSLRTIRTLRNFNIYAKNWQQEKDRLSTQNSTVTGHFRDDEDWTSVQERQVFDKIFEELANKQEMKQKSSQAILQEAQMADNMTNRKENGVHVVFGKNKQELTPQDQKLKQFLESTGRGSKETSTKITNDDIRLKPVSLMEQSDERYGLVYNFNSKFNEEILQDLRSRIRLKATLDAVLKPFIGHLIEEIETDYDFFQVVKKLLRKYSHRDQNSDVGDQTISSKVVKRIESECRNSPDILPPPYQVTLPFTLVKLLTSDDLNFPSHSKYIIASYIYQECKKASDVSLYLNVCNVDFYNILLLLSWENSRGIRQLKQLTTEMSINGIIGDLHTVQMLDKICQDLRYINDAIPDGQSQSVESSTNPSTVGVAWCRENALQLNQVENYLTKLKESLA